MAKIFEPITICGMRLKNRIVALPTVTNFADYEGYPTYQQIEAYRKRAEGGSALIIVEASFIRPDGKSFIGMQGIHTYDIIPYLNDIVEAIHEMGAKACIQITHGGRQSNPGITKRPLISPSTSRNPFLHGPEGFSRAMTTSETDQIIEQFAESASLAKAAGFDSVEIHGTHGFLVNQFMSPFTNKRNDKFGELLYFPTQLVRCCKKACGQNFPIIFRMTVDEKLEEIGIKDNGITPDLAKSFLPTLIEAGVDCFDLSNSTGESLVYNAEPIYFSPGGRIISDFFPIKQVSTVPVIGRGRINDPRLAMQIIEDGLVDMVGMARQLIADPMTPKKMMEAEYNEVRRCIACDIGCWERLIDQKRIRCAVNYNFGKEYKEYHGPPKARKKKKVLIIGAGPGGLEAARVCSELGHKVEVWEKSKNIGGMAKLASSTPSVTTRDLWRIIPWLARQCKFNGVNITFNKDANFDAVQKADWDALILAMGASLSKIEIAGQDKAPLIYLNDYYFSNVSIGQKVVVIGGKEGAEAALSLAREGKQVTLLSETDDYGNASYIYIVRKIALQQMIQKEKNIRIVTRVKIIEFTKDGLRIEDGADRQYLMKADTYLGAIGRTPNRELVHSLMEENNPNVFEIGDCKRPRRIMDAIHEANAVARMIH